MDRAGPRNAHFGEVVFRNVAAVAAMCSCSQRTVRRMADSGCPEMLTSTKLCFGIDSPHQGREPETPTSVKLRFGHATSANVAAIGQVGPLQ